MFLQNSEKNNLYFEGTTRLQLLYICEQRKKCSTFSEEKKCSTRNKYKHNSGNAICNHSATYFDWKTQKDNEKKHIEDEVYVENAKDEGEDIVRANVRIKNSAQMCNACIVSLCVCVTRV